MKIIVALVASLFLIAACSEDKEAEAHGISIVDRDIGGVLIECTRSF